MITRLRSLPIHRTSTVTPVICVPKRKFQSVGLFGTGIEKPDDWLKAADRVTSDCSKIVRALTEEKNLKPKEVLFWRCL